MADAPVMARTSLAGVARLPEEMMCGPRDQLCTHDCCSNMLPGFQDSAGCFASCELIPRLLEEVGGYSSIHQSTPCLIMS